MRSFSGDEDGAAHVPSSALAAKDRRERAGRATHQELLEVGAAPERGEKAAT